MQHFSRWAFLVARRAGAVGLIDGAKNCFEVAKLSAGLVRREYLVFKIYSLMTNIFGWTMSGKIACFSDRVLKRKPGSETLKQSWMEE